MNASGCAGHRHRTGREFRRTPGGRRVAIIRFRFG